MVKTENHQWNSSTFTYCVTPFPSVLNWNAFSRLFQMKCSWKPQERDVHANLANQRLAWWEMMMYVIFNVLVWSTSNRTICVRFLARKDHRMLCYIIPWKFTNIFPFFFCSCFLWRIQPKTEKLSSFFNASRISLRLVIRVKFHVTRKYQYPLLLAPRIGCFSYNRCDRSLWAITVSPTAFRGIVAIIGDCDGELRNDHDRPNRALLACYSCFFCVSS